jgi:hypothetical protein
MECRSRTILPLTVLLTLTGCLHAPATPEERRTGVDLVGRTESAAPIRVGVSTRQEIIQTLGEPNEVSADGRAIAYSYNPIVARSGFVVLGGPCGLSGYYPFTDRIQEHLWLAFDAEGRLKSYTSSRAKSDSDWKAFCAAASSRQ